jgi:hypothetical protein
VTAVLARVTAPTWGFTRRSSGLPDADRVVGDGTAGFDLDKSHQLSQAHEEGKGETRVFSICGAALGPHPLDAGLVGVVGRLGSGVLPGERCTSSRPALACVGECE